LAIWAGLLQPPPIPAVLMLATATALTEATVVESQRRESGRSQQFRTRTGDLFLDPGEGAGKNHGGSCWSTRCWPDLSGMPSFAAECPALPRRC
jgi:hypothetical protein